jgi:antitoxin VapB
MALSIRDPETDRLARELAALTGETLTQAIRRSVSERLQRQRATLPGVVAARIRRVDEILAEIDRLPVHDARTADEILGYDEHGLPT